MACSPQVMTVAARSGLLVHERKALTPSMAASMVVLLSLRIQCSPPWADSAHRKKTKKNAWLSRDWLYLHKT